MRDDIDKLDLPNNDRVRKETSRSRKLLVAKQVAKRPAWQAQHQKRLDYINSDPKIVADRIKRNKANSIPIVTPFGEYANANVLKKELGICFSDKLRLLPHLYYHKDKGPAPVIYETVYYAYGVLAPSAKYHYEQFLEQGLIEDRWLKLKFKPWIKWWNYMKKHIADDFYTAKEPKKEWIQVIGKPKK